MKQFGKKSVAHNLKVLLDITWTGSWTLIVLFTLYSLVVIGIALFREGNMNFFFECFSYFSDVSKYGNYMILNFVKLFFFMVNLFLLRKLFKNLINEKIFDKLNANYIKDIAIIVFLSSFIGSGELAISLSTIFYSLIIYMLSEIFKIGAKLQNENDLTV